MNDVFTCNQILPHECRFDCARITDSYNEQHLVKTICIKDAFGVDTTTRTVQLLLDYI